MSASIRRVLSSLLKEVDNMKLIGIINGSDYVSSNSTETINFWTPCTTGKVVCIGSAISSSSITPRYGFLVKDGDDYIQTGSTTGLYNIGDLIYESDYINVKIVSTGISVTYTGSSSAGVYINMFIFEWNP